MKRRMLDRAAKPLYLLVAASYVVIAVFLRTVPVAAAGATLYIDTTSSITTDNVLDTNIRLNADTNNVSLVQFGLTYDVSKLEFTGSENSGSPFTNPQASGANGDVSVSAGNNADKVNGDVVVTSLKFRILSRGSSTTLKFNNPRVYSSTNGEISSLASGATYNFAEPTTPTSNAPVTTVTPTRPVVTTSAGLAAYSAKKVAPATPVSPVSQSATNAQPEATPTVLPTQNNSEVTNHLSGSVFLRPSSTPSNQKKTSYWQWAVVLAIIMTGVAMSMYGRRVWRKARLTRKSRMAAASVIPATLASANALSDQFLPGSVVTWTSPKSQYEVIRPLAAKPLERNLTLEAAQNLQVPLPRIPVAKANASQPQTGETSEEIDADWTYDINSPLMNTL